MYSSTASFVAAMEQKGIQYSDKGQGLAGKDVISVRYSGDNMQKIEVRFFFDEGGKDVAIRIFEILKVPKDRLPAVLAVANDKNKRYRWVKFCVDTENDSLRLDLDAAFRSGDVGEICCELLSRAVGSCDECYPDFAKAVYEE